MKKLDTASDQLDDACDLYCRGRFIGALTLSGAAEELLGDLVRDRSKAEGSKIKSALGERVALIAELKGTNPDDPKEKTALISFLNNPRNELKHLRTHKGQGRAFKVKEEALEMIERAVLNFRRVTGNFPDSESFYQFLGIR